MKRFWLPCGRFWMPRSADTRRPAGPSVQDGGITRRSVLRGLGRTGAVAVALPWLEWMAGADGAWACGGLPKRFGLFFWGNGNLPEYWNPTGEGTEWELSEQLMPLADLKDKITVVSGMTVKVPNEEPHESGMAGILTGQALHIEGDDWSVQGPTIDQVIAQEIGGDTLYRSLQTTASDCNGRSYTGPDSRNPAEADPFALYERRFGENFRAPGEEGSVDPRLGLRRSVLDAVMEDISSLDARQGTSDRARLDHHLTGVRELETRLARLEEDPPNLEACSRAPEPTASFDDIEGHVQMAERNLVMAELTAMALACDQTRVFGHYISDPVGGILLPGASGGHHSLTHDEPDPQPECNEINTQIIACLADFLAARDAIPEGEGTVLDSCVIMATTDVSRGRTHSLDDFPIVLAGGGCGALKTGLHYRSTGQENASKVLLSVIRAMDILLADFGTENAFAEDGLSAIEA